MRSIEDKGCYKHGQVQKISSSSSSIGFDFHKVNGTSRSSHHRSTALGKPTPSKWDDTQKWLAGLSRGGSGEKQSATSKPRNSNADDTRLIAPVSHHENEETKKVDTCELESIWQINKHVAVRDATVAGAGVRSICVRDMGTEMTPIASQEPSRTGTPIRATTPAGRSPITSPNRELDLAPATVTRPQCVEEDFKIPDNNNNTNSDQDKTNNNPLETRALAWDETERTKYMARYKSEEVKIQAWENHQKRKAEMEMKKMEVKAERMKTRALEMLTNKLAATRRIAEEQRANAEAKLNEKSIKTSERADYIRRTGHMPSSFSFKIPSLSLCW